MIHKLSHFLLALVLVLNPLELVFAQAKMQVHTGSGRPVSCNHHMFGGESASANLKNGMLLADTVNSSQYSGRLCQSQNTCGEKLCGDCSNCAHGFVALNLAWLPELQLLPSTQLVLYKSSVLHFDSQPDLQPPRIF